MAIVHADQTEIGVTFDPVHEEMFHASKGQGATLNGKRLICPEDRRIDRGSIGTGFSKRTPRNQTLDAISRIMVQGGVFYRNASGALSLAYVAAGRLNGYIEGHMNGWDCMAGQLLLAEAGGQIERQPAQQMMLSGGRVVAAGRGVFDTLVQIADASYTG